MRPLLAVCLLCVGTASVATAAAHPRTISTSGVRLVVPVGWHAAVSTTPGCDPETLVVVSSAPVRFLPGGRLRAPGSDDVLVLLLEDRYIQDRPVGDLRRPTHFSVTWNRLARLKAVCGLPNAPAYMRYFRTHGRYLGFIVYPGARVGETTQAKTVAVMNSLRLSA